MVRENRIGQGWKGLRRLPAFLLFAVIALTAIGAVYAAALLNFVTVSDTLSIIEQPALRTPASDTLDPQADGYNNNRITSENLEASDLTGSSTSTKDDLALSDSAQAISAAYHQVSVTSDVELLESTSSGISQSDMVEIQDKKSLSSALRDGLSLLDSVGRLFIDIMDALQIIEGTSATEETEKLEIEDEENEKRRGGGGPRRVVYDESYFESRPLSRIQIRDLETTDEQGRVMTQLRSGVNVTIAVTARNYQNIDQNYAMFVQITDENGVAINIIQISGSIDDGEIAVIEGIWETQRGSYHASVFLCDGNVHPTVISEVFVRELLVN